MRPLILSIVLCTGWTTGAMLAQGHHPGGGGGHMQDMQSIHFLFEQHGQIERRVSLTANGVEAITESADETVRAQLRKHVRAMKQRLENRQPIRMWDPLFAALFEHADRIRLEIFDTPKGVRIVESSTDPEVVRLIQSHAKAVSGFVKEGMPAMHKEHPLPARTDAKD